MKQLRNEFVELRYGPITTNLEDDEFKDGTFIGELLWKQWCAGWIPTSVWRDDGRYIHIESRTYVKEE